MATRCFLTTTKPMISNHMSLSLAMIFVSSCSSPLPSHLNYWPKMAMTCESQARDIIHKFLSNAREFNVPSFSRVKKDLSKGEIREKWIGKSWYFESTLGTYVVSINGGYLAKFRSPTPPYSIPRYNADRVTEEKKPLGRSITSASWSVVEIKLHFTCPSARDRITTYKVLKFLKRISPEFKANDFKMRISSPSECSTQYHFRQKIIGDEVSNATGSYYLIFKSDGTLLSYSRETMPFRRTTHPKISRSKMLSIIQDKICHGFCSFESIDLLEMPLNNATRSVTVWIVRVIFKYPQFDLPREELTDYDVVFYPCFLFFDADTGEIIQKYSYHSWFREDSYQRKKRANWKYLR